MEHKRFSFVRQQAIQQSLNSQVFPEEVEYYIAESNGVQIDGEDIVLDDFLLVIFCAEISWMCGVQHCEVVV